MNYYNVSFLCPGNYGGGGGAGCENPEANARINRYWELVIKTLTEKGFDFRHSYVWPDGSLYQYIRSTLGPDELFEKLRDLFAPHKVLVERPLRPLPPDYQVYGTKIPISEWWDAVPERIRVTPEEFGRILAEIREEDEKEAKSPVTNLLSEAEVLPPLDEEQGIEEDNAKLR